MFSPEEKELLLNKEFFISKKNITSKIYFEFEEIKKAIEIILIERKLPLTKEILATGKINRGENLIGLPWINLDYPGYFKKENAFAIRYLFWWGTHFSVTLHLGGESLNNLQSCILKNIKESSYQHFYWCVNSNPWQYDYSLENYCMIRYLSPEHIQTSIKNGFVKISFFIELVNLENFKTPGIEIAQRLIDLLK